MPTESEFRWEAIAWLDWLVDCGVITENEISELEDDLEAMNEPSGRADVAIGIMCGWIILQ